MLVRPGLEPAASSSADRRLINWAYQAGLLKCGVHCHVHTVNVINVNHPRPPPSLNACTVICMEIINFGQKTNFHILLTRILRNMKSDAVKKNIIETLLIATYPQWPPCCFLRRIQYIHSCFLPHMRQWSLSSIPKVARVGRFPRNPQDATILWSYLHL